MKKLISNLMSIVIIMTTFIVLSAGNIAGAALPPEIYLLAPNQHYIADEEITFELRIPGDVVKDIDYAKIFIDCNKDVLKYEYDHNLTGACGITETDEGYVITFITYDIHFSEETDTPSFETTITFSVNKGDIAVNAYAVLKYSNEEEEREARLADDLPSNTVFDSDEVPRLIITGDLEIFRKGDTIYLPYSIKKAELKSKISSTHEEYQITYKPLFNRDSEYALTGDELSVNFDDRQGETVRICILGDADYNGIVNAADARKTLRYSAKLEPFPENFSEGCDFDGSGDASAADARKILRIAAKIDKFENPEITLFEDEEFIIKNLKNAGSGAYNWKCTVSDESAFEISDTIAPPENVEINPGTPFEQTFTFKALKKGTYNVHFELISSWDDEPIDEFEFTVTVWLDVPIGDNNTIMI